MVPMITADSGLPYKNARSPVTASAVFADGPSEVGRLFQKRRPCASIRDCTRRAAIAPHPPSERRHAVVSVLAEHAQHGFLDGLGIARVDDRRTGDDRHNRRHSGLVVLVKKIV